MATAIETVTNEVEYTLTGTDLVAIVADYFGRDLPSGDEAGDKLSAEVIQISSGAVVQDLLVGTNKIVVKVTDVAQADL